MHRAGWAINGKKTRRLMKELGIVSKAPKRRISTTRRKPCLPNYPNLVLNPEITRANQVWVADVT
jgi:transposase InsO family protein